MYQKSLSTDQLRGILDLLFQNDPDGRSAAEVALEGLADDDNLLVTVGHTGIVIGPATLQPALETGTIRLMHALNESNEEIEIKVSESDVAAQRSIDDETQAEKDIVPSDSVWPVLPFLLHQSNRENAGGLARQFPYSLDEHGVTLHRQTPFRMYVNEEIRELLPPGSDFLEILNAYFPTEFSVRHLDGGIQELHYSLNVAGLLYFWRWEMMRDTVWPGLNEKPPGADPVDWQAREYGMQAFMLGDLGEASEFFEKARFSLQKDIILTVSRGVIALVHDNNPSKAGRLWRQALELCGSDYIRSFLSLLNVFVCYIEGDIDSGLRYLKAAKQAFPQWSLLSIWEAKLCLVDNRAADAFRLVAKLINAEPQCIVRLIVDPDFHGVRDEILRLYVQMGERLKTKILDSIGKLDRLVNRKPVGSRGLDFFREVSSARARIKEQAESGSYWEKRDAYNELKSLHQQAIDQCLRVSSLALLDVSEVGAKIEAIGVFPHEDTFFLRGHEIITLSGNDVLPSKPLKSIPMWQHHYVEGSERAPLFVVGMRRDKSFRFALWDSQTMRSRERTIFLENIDDIGISFDHRFIGFRSGYNPSSNYIYRLDTLDEVLEFGGPTDRMRNRRVFEERLEFLPDGRPLVFHSHGFFAINPETRSRNLSWEGRIHPHLAAIDPTGQFVALDTVPDLTIIGLASGEIVTQQRIARIRHMHFTPGGEHLCIAGEKTDVYDAPIYMVSTATWKIEHICYAHQNEVTATQFTPDGHSLLSIGADEHLKVWSVPELKLITQTELPERGRHLTVAPSGDIALVTYGKRHADGYAVFELSRSLESPSRLERHRLRRLRHGGKSGKQ